jgi:hypothetical protein
MTELTAKEKGRGKKNSTAQHSTAQQALANRPKLETTRFTVNVLKYW